MFIIIKQEVTFFFLFSRVFRWLCFIQWHIIYANEQSMKALSFTARLSYKIHSQCHLSISNAQDGPSDAVRFLASTMAASLSE